MKIGIIGTRGIPNEYGGFEQLAEKLSVGLVKNGHEVIVYNSHRHSYQQKKFHGVQIVHCFDAEYIMGTAGQFVYDFNCVMDARRRNFDVLLFLGYTSSSVWGKLYPKNTVIISNMDGFEWKRQKYSKPVRRFLKYAEKLAVQYSHFFIADSIAMHTYLENKYNRHSEYIAYGAEIIKSAKEELLTSYDLCKKNYFMLMARMEPENNIEMILDGFHQSASEKKFVVVGNMNNKFGKHIIKKFGSDRRIVFAGAIYDNELTHTLKTNCPLYFHGHTVGGTNPSLIEAMASRVLIAAHDNHFNRAVLNENGYYFSSSGDVKSIIEGFHPAVKEELMTQNNFEKIQTAYNWPLIIQQYESFIHKCYNAAR
jgi:glycosyltransferase involved in cell wall biosynthesis